MKMTNLLTFGTAIVVAVTTTITMIITATTVATAALG
jgi:hypothetical protein